MKRILSIAVLGSSLLGLPMLMGCDGDKSTTTKTETTVHPDGSTSTDKSKTTVDSNGNQTTQTEKKTQNP